MMPIRTAPPRTAGCLAAVTLGIVLSGCLPGRAAADRLPIFGIEEFRALLLQDRSISSDDPDPANTLADRRRKLRDAARRLPSLGEVSRALLLTEWGSAYFEEIETPVPLDKIEEAVLQPSEDDFKREVRKLIKMGGDDSNRVIDAISAEIKRDVRSQMLERLEQRIRVYLRSERAADRIAAANLVSDTMSSARRQESSEQTGGDTGGRRKPSEGSRSLRQRMAPLARDLQNLLRNRDPQVQVAAVRALSNLEGDAAATVAALRPLLQGEQINVVTRRATAAGLAHMVEVLYQEMNKGRPTPTLKALGQIFPAAAMGLADADTEVRRSCLAACQEAVTTLDELVGDRGSAMESTAIYRPMISVVEKSIVNLNRAARDPVPSLRVEACHLLERLVMVSHKVRHLGETRLPPPLPDEMEKEPRKGPDKDKEPPKGLDKDKEPRKGPDKDKEPGKGPDKDKEPGEDVKGPSLSGRDRHLGTARPSEWATSRSTEPMQTTLLRPVPLRPIEISLQVATLDRPVKIAPVQQASRPAPSEGGVSRVVFLARQVEDLPLPSKLETGLKDTIDAMIAGLSDPDYRVRLASVDVLETFGDRAAPAIPALVKALRDSNKFVRWAAARTLRRLAPRDPREVVPGLMCVLNDREDLSVRITAAYAIENYGPAAKEAVPLLARVINRGDKEYIIAVLHALQGIGTDAKPALPNVAWILSDTTLPASVRVEAAQTLGRFGPLAKGQLPQLRQIMVRDTNEDVRNAASSAVLAIDRPER